MQKSTNLQKYESKNPVRRFLLGRFIKKIGKMVAEIKPEVVLDAGCGEGMVISFLDKEIWREGKRKKVGKLEWKEKEERVVENRKLGGKNIDFYGIDMSERAIEEARKRLPHANMQTGSVYVLPYADNFFDLTICSEVLEHLDEPEKALLELKRVSKKYVLLSVPNEPWFRISSFMSGKYLKSLGNHPEHVQNWTAGQFVKMVEKHFRVLRVETSFPWTIVLCEM